MQEETLNNTQEVTDTQAVEISPVVTENTEQAAQVVSSETVADAKVDTQVSESSAVVADKKPADDFKNKRFTGARKPFNGDRKSVV